jgi:hypothetical protein
MPEKRADSHPSSVSMQVATDGLRSGTFLGTLRLLVNGHAYPGTLREGPVETCMRSSIEGNKLAQVFDCPVRIRLTEKGRQVPQLASVCDPAALKTKRARPSAGRDCQHSKQEYTPMNENVKRYIGLDVHKHYLIAWEWMPI